MLRHLRCPIHAGVLSCVFLWRAQVARSGRFLLAGMGQEPRLGRWGRHRNARNGVLLHRLPLADE